jgi:hypothetical protein
MKLTNILQGTNRSFASVFLAFSLFGFLFPHKADQRKQNHHVNLITTEQAAQPEPADDGSQYVVLLIGKHLIAAFAGWRRGQKDRADLSRFFWPRNLFAGN